MTVSIQLEEWEWDMVDAEAAACGITREALLREMVAEEAELVLNDMLGLSRPWDRQWKSH